MDFFLSLLCALILFYVLLLVALVLIGAVRDLCTPFVRIYRWVML